MSQPLIDFQNVFLIYQNNTALSDLTLTINQGEFISVFGENGSGKSSFLKLAAGLLFPSSGHILINGKSLLQMKELEILKFHTKCGFIFQNPALISNISLYENLYLYYQYNTDLSDSEIKKNIDEFLNIFNFNSDMKLRPGALSIGEKMQINIIRALIPKPEILYIDNPFNVADKRTRNIMIHIIESLKEKKTTILCSGLSQKQIFELSDRILFLEHGKISLNQSIDDIKYNKYPVLNKFFQN